MLLVSYSSLFKGKGSASEEKKKKKKVSDRKYKFLEINHFLVEKLVQ